MHSGGTGGFRLRGRALVELDVDRELNALDTCLGDFPHPIGASVRHRALYLASSIVSGAPRGERYFVAKRLETMLLRHGITECCDVDLQAQAAEHEQRISFFPRSDSDVAHPSNARPGSGRRDPPGRQR